MILLLCCKREADVQSLIKVFGKCVGTGIRRKARCPPKLPCNENIISAKHCLMENDKLNIINLPIHTEEDANILHSKEHRLDLIYEDWSRKLNIRVRYMPIMAHMAVDLLQGRGIRVGNVANDDKLLDNDFDPDMLVGCNFEIKDDLYTVILV